MADQEQLEILKQGADVWNKWRKENPSSEISLHHVDLRGINLSRVDLRRADLKGSLLSGVELREANLGEANLRVADLDETSLSGANLGEACLHGASLYGTDLNHTDLSGADLRYASMGRANLFSANLVGAILHWADLRVTDFKATIIGGTSFAGINLGVAKNLEHVVHKAASSVSNDTLQFSDGKIPEVFLRGCGLSDWEIESAKLFNPDLSNEEINKILYKMYDVRATQSIQISPLFISYSHSDGKFVDKLEELLNKQGVRFWRDIHDATSGKLEKQIDRAIRQNPTVLLILSKNSIKSDWVQHEVRKAREMEKDIGRDVLCPVALDESWKTSPWPERIMEQVMEYNILDFSIWNDDDKFKNIFGKLIDGLNLYYKK